MEALINFWKNIISEYIFDKQPLSNIEAEIENLLSNSRLNPKMVLLIYKKTFSAYSPGSVQSYPILLPKFGHVVLRHSPQITGFRKEIMELYIHTPTN